MTRFAARVDANQSDIVAALRAVGATVQTLHTVGKGCPDILVGYRGQNYALEIKDGQKPPSHRTLTDAETNWHRDWRGQVAIVCDVKDALTAIGALRGTIS